MTRPPPEQLSLSELDRRIALLANLRPKVETEGARSSIDAELRELVRLRQSKLRQVTRANRPKP